MLVKKGLLVLASIFSLFFSFPAWADQQTTVLTEELRIKKALCAVPYIDGSNNATLEKEANALLREIAAKLVDKVGGAGTMDYRVTLNRPSLVSLLLEARNGSKRAVKGMNIDLTSGREFGISEFFMNNAEFNALIASSKEILYTEEGLLLAPKEFAAYTELLPYSEVLEYMRIGEAGRILQIARLTRSSEGKILKLKQGGLLAFKLDSNPSTGYGWELSADEGVVKVGSSFVMPKTNDQRVGTPGVDIIFLAVQGAGTHNIVFSYKRPWERLIIDSFKLTVEVAE